MMQELDTISGVNERYERPLTPDHTHAEWSRARMADYQFIGYVYVITNTVNGKQYVGQTWRTVTTRWTAHCNAARTTGDARKMPIVRAIRRYGSDAFRVETLDTKVGCSQEELDAAEHAAILRLDTIAPRGYNLRLGGSHGRLHEATKAKIRATRMALGLHHSAEHKARLRAMMLGRPVTWGDKISAALAGRAVGAAAKGRPKSAEHRAKISAAHKGRKKPAETVARVSAALKGRKFTPEQKQKISDGLRRSGALKGRVFTDEWKAKLSISRRQRSADGRDPLRSVDGRWATTQSEDE
jgi:group I intron endonuclease